MKKRNSLEKISLQKQTAFQMNLIFIAEMAFEKNIFLGIDISILMHIKNGNIYSVSNDNVFYRLIRFI